MIAACIGGTITCLSPIYIKTFGQKYGVLIYASNGICVGASAVIGPIIAKFCLSQDTKESTHYDYFIVYVISAALVTFPLIMNCFFKENKPYMYKNQNYVNPMLNYKSIRNMKLKGNMSFSVMERKGYIKPICIYE